MKYKVVNANEEIIEMTKTREEAEYCIAENYLKGNYDLEIKEIDYGSIVH